MDIDEFNSQVATLACSFIASNVLVIEKLKEQVVGIQVEYNKVLATNALLHEQKCSLNDQVLELQEEILNFKRVSQIIAYEKENARLKKEIEHLTRAMVKPLAFEPVRETVKPLESVKVVEETAKSPVDDVEAIETAKALDVAPIEVELEFVEQTIGHVVYYVTDDKKKLIYERLPDGDVGEHVGAIVKKKAVFL